MTSPELFVWVVLGSPVEVHWCVYVHFSFCLYSSLGWWIVLLEPWQCVNPCLIHFIYLSLRKENITGIYTLGHQIKCSMLRTAECDGGGGSTLTSSSGLLAHCHPPLHLPTALVWQWWRAGWQPRAVAGGGQHLGLGAMQMSWHHSGWRHPICIVTETERLKPFREDNSGCWCHQMCINLFSTWKQPWQHNGNTWNYSSTKFSATLFFK